MAWHQQTWPQVISDRTDKLNDVLAAAAPPVEYRKKNYHVIGYNVNYICWISSGLYMYWMNFAEDLGLKYD